MDERRRTWGMRPGDHTSGTFGYGSAEARRAAHAVLVAAHDASVAVPGDRARRSGLLRSRRRRRSLFPQEARGGGLWPRRRLPALLGRATLFGERRPLLRDVRAMRAGRLHLSPMERLVPRRVGPGRIGFFEAGSLGRRGDDGQRIGGHHPTRRILLLGRPVPIRALFRLQDDRPHARRAALRRRRAVLDRDLPRGTVQCLAGGSERSALLLIPFGRCPQCSYHSKSHSPLSLPPSSPSASPSSVKKMYEPPPSFICESE